MPAPSPRFDAETLAWLRLAATPTLNRRVARQLLAVLGSPCAIFDTAPDTLRALGASPALVDALRNPPPGFDAELTATDAWLAQAPADAPRRVLTLGDADYPARWLQSPDPPLRVYLAGDASRIREDAVAVVGSRHATPQGLDNARAFARALGERGWTVVSGLAIGIDAAAHEGALDTPGGTVAVIGCGPDVVYPPRHRGLYARIASDGALISEFPPGTPPKPAHFPQRNRLIAALGRGTLVVEAALQSGSLITARLALEVGAEVFAIPGSIHSPQSRGCHALIQQGAKLVTSADDILDELGALSDRPRNPPATGPATTDAATPAADEMAEDPLLAAMGWEPISLDDLSAHTGRPAADLAARLLDLELQGRVRRLPGQRFQRHARA
jgi:DNA processing protein